MSFLQSLSYDLMDNRELHFAENVVLTEKEQWLVTLSSNFSTFTGDYVNAIETGRDSDTIKKSLGEMWEISDKDSLLKVLDWLVKEGHRKQYSAELDLLKLVYAEIDHKNPLLKIIFSEIPKLALLKLQFINKADIVGKAKTIGLSKHQVLTVLPESIDWMRQIHKSDVGNIVDVSNLVAWDAVRLVNLCRWSVQLGYISKDEFVGLADQLTDQVKAAYHSWEEVMVAYAVGAFIWNHSEARVEHMIRTFMKLKHTAQSPIKHVPFK